MRVKKLVLLFLGLFGSLSACTGVEIPNVRVCAVAGVMAAGADCAWTLSDKIESMNLDQFIDFLEPDSNTGKGAALCQSSADWNKQKTALELACKSLGAKCTKETIEALQFASKQIKALELKVDAKTRNSRVQTQTN